MIDLKGNNLTFSPASYTWTDNDFGNPYSGTYYLYIGRAGNVLRLYDSTDTSGKKLTINTTEIPAPSGFRVRYTGGTYVENGTLSVQDSSTSPFGPQGTHPAGSVTLGTTSNYTARKARLEIGSNVTAHTDLSIPNNLLGIPVLRVRHAQTEFSTNSNVRLEDLYLEQAATAMHISILQGISVDVRSYTNDTVNTISGTELKIGRKGVLDFNTNRLDGKIAIDLANDAPPLAEQNFIPATQGTTTS